MKKVTGALTLIICFVLAISLFCSCSVKSSTEKQGKYVEEEYDMPSGIKNVSDLRLLGDGKIGMLGIDDEYENLSYYISKDGGKSWANKKLPLQKVEEGTVRKVSYSKIDKKGNIYIGYQIYTKENWDKMQEIESETSATNNQVEESKRIYNEAIFRLVKIDLDGNLSEVNNIDSSQVNCNCYLTNIDDNGDFYFTNHIIKEDVGSLFLVRVDHTTGKITSKFNEGTNNVESYLVVNNTMFYQVSGVTNKYSIDDGHKLGSISELKGSDGGQTTYFSSGNNNLMYYSNQKGIYSYDIKKDKSKVILDTSSSSYSISSLITKKIISKKDGGFLVVYSSGNSGGDILCNYEYDSGSSKEKHKLTVYSLYKDQELNDAINSYQRKHKNISLKYEVGVVENSPITEDDAIKVLNTELKAGKGPDVIFLDGLSTKNYEKQGLLEDISDVISNKNDSLLNNVVDAYTNKNNKIYEFPLKFKIPVVTGKDVSNISDLDSFTKAVEEASSNNQRDILNVNEPKVLLNMLYYSCAGSWINKDNSLNKTNLKTFLIDARTIYKATDKSHSQSEIDAYNEMIKHTKGSQHEKKYYEDYLQCHDIFNNYFKNPCIYNIYYLSCPYFVSMQEAFNKQTGNYNYDIWKGQIGNYFLPDTIVGVNAHSNEKKNAKELISTLLDGNILNNEFSFSVNKNILQDSLNKKIDSSIDNGDISSSIKMESLSEQSKNDLLNKINKLKSVPYTDKIVLDKASDAICDYISGKTTSVDDAVKAISEKIEIRLSE